MEKATVEKFFARYERFFAQSLDGMMHADEIESLYAREYIAASPLGVMAGKNDIQFRKALAQGYEEYRRIGTKEMRVRSVGISPIDDLHCVAHVAWTATYATGDNPNIAIDFDVHYLMQELDGEPKVFGWISGDEQKLLNEYGVT